MAQVSWLFLDDFGGKHRVGLYHGDSSGHLVIYANMKVVQVDFSVKEPRTYSFFLGDELVEVRLAIEKNGLFSYEFATNRSVDTPLNRFRKTENQKNRWQTALFFGGGLALVISAFFALRAYNRHLREKRWADSGIVSSLSKETMRNLTLAGKTATARVFIVHEGSARRAVYAFSTEAGQQIQGKTPLPDTGGILLPTGFELQDRDEFQVLYLPGEPKTHHLRYDQPTPGQIENYLRTAAAAEQLAHPTKTAASAACLAALVLQEKGWPRLADLANQTTEPWKNGKHNRDSYQRLLRDVEFEKKWKDACWDK